jgi:Nucleoside 2-deoxyribosyltransferase like
LYVGGNILKVFLGGTCNDSPWRNRLIPLLANYVDYFDPVVEDWNEDSYQAEMEARENCDYCLYVITPAMMGVYSIAEAIDDSNKRPEKTIFCYLYTDNGNKFNTHQIKSLEATNKLIKRNGGYCFDSLSMIAHFLNVKGLDES